VTYYTSIQTAENDEFTGKLLQIYKSIRSAGIACPITLGLHRSDYMLHSVEDDPRQLMQVEMNTIAASFGSLSSKISTMHRTLHQTDEMHIPFNEPYVEFANGIAVAHQRYLANCPEGTEAKVVMIVQPGERNIADQWLLQFALLEKHGITCARYTLEEVCILGRLGERSELILEGSEVSVVYFRFAIPLHHIYIIYIHTCRHLLEQQHAITTFYRSRFEQLTVLFSLFLSALIQSWIYAGRLPHRETVDC
jgi:hypothetical protein